MHFRRIFANIYCKLNCNALQKTLSIALLCVSFIVLYERYYVYEKYVGIILLFIKIKRKIKGVLVTHITC